MIRLLLVDDQDLIRRGMTALLKSDGALQVVGETANGQEAIAIVASLTPDVVLMDVRMLVMDGVAATKAICQQFPGTKILMLTTFDDQEHVTQALQNDASGYLLKDTPFDELVQAIRFVHKGYTHVGPGLVNNAVTMLPVAALTPALAELTPREQEILQLIAQGASNREIAQSLYISEKTVRNYVRHPRRSRGLNACARPKDGRLPRVWLLDV